MNQPLGGRPVDLPAKVLYIENHTESRLLVTRLLEIEGCEVISCSDGVRGLELSFTLHPDLILVDLNLPFMDGYETATRLKMSVHRIQGAVPVIATSIYASHDEREMALAAGCDGFIPKPFDVDSFVGNISRYYRGHRDSISAERERNALVRYHQRLVEKLEARATAVLLDEETRTYNEAYLYRRLDEEASRAVRLGDVFSIAVVTIEISRSDSPADLFEERRKIYAGVAEIMRSGKRVFDIVARVGEDSFCLFFGGCCSENVDMVTRRLCSRLAERLPALLPRGMKVDISFGTNTYTGGLLVPRTFVRAAMDRLKPFVP